jgi:hypothetical protein
MHFRAPDLLLHSWQIASESAYLHQSVPFPSYSLQEGADRKIDTRLIPIRGKLNEI